MPGSPLSAAADIRDRLHAAGLVLHLEDGALRYSAPPGALTEELRREVRACREDLIALLRQEAQRAEDGWHFTASPESAHAPFPLTDLQQAYLIGEQEFYDHSAPAVFVHEYAFPAEALPDPDALQTALSLLRRAHGALRLAVSADGTQQIRPVHDGPEPRMVDRRDLTALPGGSAERELLLLRERLAEDLPPYAEGRPFLVRLVLLPDGTARLQIALRLIAFDGVTTQLFFTELARCCADPDYLPQTVVLSFRDYVRGLEERRAAGAHRSARRYWERRAVELPPAPALPSAVLPSAPQPPVPVPAAEPLLPPQPPTDSPAEPEPPRGSALRRLSTRLDPASWARLRAHAATAGLPAGSALFGLFVESLHRWSDGAAGVLTVLAAHRPGSHPDIARVWGNASTTVLVGYGPSQPEAAFTDRCRLVQRGLYADLAELEVSGVEVSRILQGLRAGTGSPAPVVFTSGLDLVDGAPGGFLLPLPGAALVHSSISTPQILLDHQVYEEAGELVCNFDYAEDAYPPRLVEELADYHQARLRALADAQEEWSRPGPPALPAAQLADRLRANDTGTPLPSGTLHSSAVASCGAAPDAPAVHDAAGTLSRAGLEAASAALALRLRTLGVGDDPGGPRLVGIRVPRGRAQSVAVLGVLRAGGAYVPIDPGWPAARVSAVLRHSGARALVGDSWPELDACLPEEVRVIPVNDGPVPPGGPARRHPGREAPGGSPDRTAYVIYTSGSTGDPKGVAITHRAVVNTLQDLTSRFALSDRDKVFAVSSLAFDLSVFDQFALLGCGGSVVCPPDSPVPDPQTWAEYVHRHGATVWNSVPALLLLTLEYLGDRARELLSSLRLVMLSGDWVPLPLLDRLADACPGAEVVVMGGATEASIWSNIFPAADLPTGWQSVPYGTPLANQTMHVLDRGLADSPTWVPGDLYIGGAGLASGYLEEPERTAAAFLHHPRTGERLYRTGDRARYRPGGVLEFLGRADQQVKINGYRVELGEIEAQLTRLPGICSAVALVDTSRGEPFLAAFTVRDRPEWADLGPGGTAGPDGEAKPDSEAVRAALGRALPPYMVPSLVLDLPKLPLSGNGKVDRKALLDRLADAVRTAPGSDRPDPGGPAEGHRRGPATRTEARLLDLWRELLGPAVCDVTDDFFALGGNSLGAVRLFRRIETVFGRRLPLASLFASRTVRDQAALLGCDAGTASGDGPGPLVGLGGDGAQHVVFVHPVGGDVLCYQPIVSAVQARSSTAALVSLHGLRAAGPTGRSNPANSVDAMARDYARALLGALPTGPLHLAGWSMGGAVALHTAVLLERAGRTVTSLTTVDAFVGRPDACAPDLSVRLAGFFGDLTGRGDLAERLPAGAPGATDDERLLAAHDALVAAGLLDGPVEPAELLRLFTLYRDNSEILERHVPVGWQAALPAERPAPPWLLIRAEGTRHDAFPALMPLDRALPTARPTALPLTVRTVAEDHFSVVRGAGAVRLADRIAEVVEQTAAVGSAGLPFQVQGARG
ncbi:amino acid adenylation domain-containing protein [Peterkaempfera bronchialis]|uniref:non-ribosomal peptide synthetase n=1 Tax=Peterkaempfera bronchialis TaxID=2126346 RepID=UPI003C2B2CCD